VLSRVEDARFPFRIEILSADGTSLVLRAQDRWPVAGRNIFCLRETAESAPGIALEELERLPILALQRRGVRLSIVLDRPRYKRCDFLFTRREYRNRPGEWYEQIFWQTQTSMMQRRPSIGPSALRSKSEYNVLVASDERYPWTFPASGVTRGKLACGDYALADGDQMLAVVERKTRENLLADFGTLAVLHQRMLELATHEHAALVIEAPYEDFLNRSRTHVYSPAFCAATIAELYAEHPRLKIVFCSNRKAANLWTRHFFAAVWEVRQRRRR
jgi:hypothetical protein